MGRSMITSHSKRLIATVLGLTFLATGSPAGAPQAGKQAPGYYRMMLGQLEVTALLDGTHPFPIPTTLTVPRERALTGEDRPLMSHARPGTAEALLAQERLALPFEGSINAFLVNLNGRLVLIDSGAGALYGKCCGQLLANLRASGYAPEQIDDVFITHLHTDHIGGVVENGQPSFPNATLHVSKQDVDYWLDSANEAKAPAILRSMFNGARSALRPHQEAGRLVTFNGEGEVLPGIKAVPTPGHTPGHTSYLVGSGGEQLLVWGDIVHVSPIQFPDPAVTVTYDSDAWKAEQRRLSLFAEAATKGFWIGAAHISFPGLGHITARDGHYRWLPANYTTRVDQAVGAQP